MKIAKLSMLVMSVIALSACGGGGSGGGSMPQAKPENINKPEVKPNTTPETPQVTHPVEQPQKPEKTQPSEPEMVVTPPKENRPSEIEVIKQREFPQGKVENVDVGFGVVTGYNNKYSFNGAWKEKKPQDEIKGKLLEEAKLSLKDKIALLGGLKGIILSETFTALWNKFANDSYKKDVFYFGDETPVAAIENMKGKATYKGNATRYDNVKGIVSNVGNSTLDVDFDTKKISGELAMNGIRRNIALKESDIKGNRFEGRAVAGENSLFTTREGTYEGQFFGPNAEEIAGETRFGNDKELKDLKDLDTSFSAEKQAK